MGSMQSLAKMAVVLSQEFIWRHYVTRELDFVASCIDEQIMWIGPLEHQFVVGRDKMKEILSAEQEIFFQVLSSDLQLIAQDENSCVVAGRIEICTDERAEYAFKCKQRWTFVYKTAKERPLITHLHVSESWDMLNQGEFFPFRAAKQTYQYMQQLLRNKISNFAKLTVYDTKRRLHFIMEQEIIYVEASNVNCYLYCISGEFLITKSISAFQKSLSNKFIRIHRSYLVNVDYVTEMERFAVQLCEGTKLPIPEKKYVCIREQIRKVAWLYSSENSIQNPKHPFTSTKSVSKKAR